MFTYEITEEKKFDNNVIDVDLSGLKSTTGSGSFLGDVEIEIEGKGWTTFSGEHGKNDYKREFGFVIVQK